MVKKLPSLIISPVFVLCSHMSKAQVLDAGESHNLYVCTDSVHRSWGFNPNGQLGLGTTSTKAVPSASPTLGQVVAVAAGGNSTLYLKADGTVWGSGLNNYGQLGQGTTSTTNSTPVQIPSLSNVVAIASGAGHSLFLKNDGTVWGCGLNTDGQLGNGASANELSPVQIPGLSNVSAIAAGGNHSLFLMSDGTVMSCGLNLEGQLGMGMFSINSNVPVNVSTLTNIVKISAGWSFSLFLKNDGTVWSCGGNDSGQLGLGTTTDQHTPVQVTTLTNITAVESGTKSNHSLFLKSDSTVWVCGENGTGQLGLGTNTDLSTPVQNTFIGQVVNMAAGTYHSIFIKGDGTGMGSGGNAYGQLGAGNFTNSLSLVPMAELCPAVTGVEEEKHQGILLNIYPNPASHTVSITGANPIQQVELYSSTGALVLSESTGSISVAGLPAGIYLVKVTTAKGIGYSRLVKE